MTPCAHCPVGPGCRSVREGNRGYCTYADKTHPAFMPDIESVLRGEVEFFDASSRKDLPKGPSLGTQMASSVTTATTTIDPLIPRIEACDFRYSSCGCLSKPAQCRQAGYPALVILDDCRRCLAP